MPVCEKCGNTGFVTVRRGAHEEKIACPVCQPIGIQALEKTSDAFMTPFGEKIAIIDRHSIPK
jgi:hypothetical protein